jgi:hypothetical protein
MYGGHPNRSRFTSACRAGLWGRGTRRADSLQSSLLELGSSRERTNLSDSTQRPPEQTLRVPPLKALHALCRIDAGMRIVPPPKLTSMRGVSPASTPSSASFVDWNKCGSRTRDTRLIRPLLYPSELTCGGMKQSGRAVRACATRSGAQARQAGLRTHCRCTIDVSTSSRDRGNPRSQILPVVLSIFSPPKTTRPRSAAPSGVSVRDCSGDCRLVSPATYANEANASQFPRRAQVHRGNSRDFLRRLSAPNAAAC